MKQKKLIWLVIFLCCFTQLLFSNPIPIPSLMMPEEWIDVLILEEGETGTSPGLRAVVDGKYPMWNLEFKKVRMLDPVPPGSQHITVRMDEEIIPFGWSNLTYQTILPEWREIPQLEWTIAPVPDRFTLYVHYEHGLIERPDEVVFLYPLGCWEGQPVYTEIMTAYFTVNMPNRYVPKGVFLDYDPVPFDMEPVYRATTNDPNWLISGDYESERFHPIEKDYICTMIDRWNDPLCWFSQVPDMADGVDIISSSDTPGPCLYPVDDFIATSTGVTPSSIATIKWWGSFPGWAQMDPHAKDRDSLPPRPRNFTIYIYDSAVTNADEVKPGRLVYKAEIKEFHQSYYGMVVREIPAATEDYVYIYEHEFKYEAVLKNPFTPVPGERYWMSIVAGPVTGHDSWGWATSIIDDTQQALAVDMSGEEGVDIYPVDDIVNSYSHPYKKRYTPVQMAFSLCTSSSPVPSAIPYMLIDGSYLTVEYAYGDSGGHEPPILTVPINGDFLLLPVMPDGVTAESLDSAFSHFKVRDLEFRSSYNPELYWGHNGVGDYLLSKNNSDGKKQRMKLQMAIDRCAPLYFDSGYVEVPGDIDFPWIDIQLYMVSPYECGNIRYTLKLIAVPWANISFSTEVGLTSGNSGNRKVSDGDLLSTKGVVLRTNRELLKNFYPNSGIYINRDYGLDALLSQPLSVSNQSSGNKKDIWFSIETDLVIGNRYYDDGDLLSDRGIVIRDNISLVSPFHPMPVIPPMGLDAVTFNNPLPDDGVTVTGPPVYPEKKLLYSFEVNFFSESLGTMVGHGDLLLENGTIYRTNEQLMKNFKPVSGNEEDPGLDAVYLWPNGEIWFSTEEEFIDQRLGYIGHGDLLSSNGRVVMKNLSLVREFAPIEDLHDFGLDGLHINLNRPFAVSGVLVQGVECVLLQTDDGHLYVLENYGNMKINTRVWVEGVLDPDCVSICQQGDGCIMDNIIFSLEPKINSVPGTIIQMNNQ